MSAARHPGGRAPSSPGSIFAVLGMTPADGFVGVISAVVLGALVTFLTVVVSSYRVSRLNIVAAIRDLPEDFGTNRTVVDAWQRSVKRLPRRPSQMVIRSLLTGIGLLIVVSVALDLVQRIEANLVMRNYGGFLGGSTRIKGAYT